MFNNKKVKELKDTNAYLVRQLELANSLNSTQEDMLETKNAYILELREYIEKLKEYDESRDRVIAIQDNQIECLKKLVILDKAIKEDDLTDYLARVAHHVFTTFFCDGKRDKVRVTKFLRELTYPIMSIKFAKDIADMIEAKTEPIEIVNRMKNPMAGFTNNQSPTQYKWVMLNEMKTWEE
jgi:hypothetical protein